MMEGANSTMVYCKNFCKCHSVSAIQLKNYRIKKEKENAGETLLEFS
jgi:hypothetical protein